jgi:hypothetical protein
MILSSHFFLACFCGMEHLEVDPRALEGVLLSCKTKTKGTRKPFVAKSYSLSYDVYQATGSRYDVQGDQDL